MANLKIFIPAVSSVDSPEILAEVCEVQVVAYEGDGNLTLTGELGECAQQTALVAISFLCSTYPKFREEYTHSNVHIHVRSENMIDGASCGLGMCLALWSGIFNDTTQAPVRLLVTGEMDLFGTVHEVGGVSTKQSLFTNDFAFFFVPAKNISNVPDCMHKMTNIKGFARFSECLEFFESTQHRYCAP